MKRPVIKDKSILAYIEYLEHQLTSDATEKKFLRGIQRQVDLLADKMLSEKLDVDEIAKILKEAIPIIQGMSKFEKQAFPKEDVKKSNPDTADAFL